MKIIWIAAFLAVGAFAPPPRPSPISGGAGGGGGGGSTCSGSAGQILVSDGGSGCTGATPTISGSTITASLTGHASLDLPLTGGTLAGNLLFTDATYDIGATGATRPRDLFLSRNAIIGGTLGVTGQITGNLTGTVTGHSSLDCALTGCTMAGNLLFTDATYDIGATGATRPRDLFLSRNAIVGGTLGVTGLASFTAGIATGASPPALTAGTGGAGADAEGTVPSVGAASGVCVTYADSTAHAYEISCNNGSYYPIGRIVAFGAKALDFASTATGACATVITDTATGAASTDTILFNANASIKAVTGYVPASTGGFSIAAFPTTNTVSFEGCNWTSGTVDPGSITVNWMVLRK